MVLGRGSGELMADPPFGRLERVADIRTVWPSEASDFTPWLANPDNIQLLGEAIRVELEVEAQEQAVGPFRADILCKDTATGHYVLVENQVERTDHTHLGQLLTYAAGLDAATIVWVARKFADEHRAALDWLNRATADGLNFFGLEIEVWRIGASPWAPKFNVVSQPNGWPTVIKASEPPRTASPTQQLHLDFWTQFKGFLEERGSTLRIGTPSRDHWRYFPVGRTHFTLSVTNNMSSGWSAISLVLTGPDSKPHFYLLRDERRDEIEASLGSLEWEELPGRNESRVTLRRPQSPAEKSTWAELNLWMADRLEQWTDFFRPIVTALDASEYQDPDAAVEPSDESS